jgi:cytochrome c oxidase cbb3-type subunit 3
MKWGFARILLIFAVVGCAVASAAQSAASNDNNAAGATLFSQTCAACHGTDGRGGERAPDIATDRGMIALSEADLTRIVERGVAGTGMPSFAYLGPEKVGALVAHLRALQGRVASAVLSGDPEKGRSLYFGSAGCSRCHMLHGQGGGIAEDLSAYGDGPSAATIRQAITDPDRNLEPTSQIVEVRTRDGHTIAGLLREDDNFALALQTPDGQYHMFRKANLVHVVYTRHSSMPTDYGQTLSSTDLDNLVSFLVRTADTSSEIQRKSAKVGDED